MEHIAGSLPSGVDSIARSDESMVVRLRNGTQVTVVRSFLAWMRDPTFELWLPRDDRTGISEMQATLTEREVIDHLFRMATTRLRWHHRNFALPVWKEWRNLTECFALSDHIYTQYGCLTLSHAQRRGRDEIARRTSYKDDLGLTLDYDISALCSRGVFFEDLPAAGRSAWRNIATLQQSLF